jgi:hypothetical protein
LLDARAKGLMSGNDAHGVCIEWSGSGGGCLKNLQLGILWGIAIVASVCSVLAVVNRQAGAWVLVGFSALVFLPLALAFSYVFRESKGQRIVVEMERGMISFEDVFLLAGFLPRRLSFSCRLDELQRVELAKGRGGGLDWLYIHTPVGRVVVHSASDNFRALSKYLVEAVPKGRVPMTTRYWFPAVLAILLVGFGVAVAFWMQWLP